MFTLISRTLTRRTLKNCKHHPSISRGDRNKQGQHHKNAAEIIVDDSNDDEQPLELEQVATPAGNSSQILPNLYNRQHPIHKLKDSFPDSRIATMQNEKVGIRQALKKLSIRKHKADDS